MDEKNLAEEDLYEWATALPIRDGRIQWGSLGDIYQFGRMLALAGLTERGETVLQTTFRLLAGIQLGLDPMRSLAATSRYGSQIKPNLSYAMARLYEQFPKAKLTIRWVRDGKMLPLDQGRPSSVRRGEDLKALAACMIAPGMEWEFESYSLAEAEREGLLDGRADSWWVVNTAHAMAQRATAWLLRRILPGAYELRDDDRPQAGPAVKVESTPGVEPPVGKPTCGGQVVAISPERLVPRQRRRPKREAKVSQEEAVEAVENLERNGYGVPRGEEAAAEVARAEIRDEREIPEAAKVAGRTDTRSLRQTLDELEVEDEPWPGDEGDK